MVSPDWMQQETAAAARAEALARLARYEREREERFAEYRAAWDRKFAAEKAKAASKAGAPSRYLRVVR